MSAFLVWWASMTQSTRQMILVALFALAVAALMASAIAPRNPRVSIWVARLRRPAMRSWRSFRELTRGETSLSAATSYIWPTR
jgi:hypothetical protein